MQHLSGKFIQYLESGDEDNAIKTVKPEDVLLRVNNSRDTVLHMAVRKKLNALALILIKLGANPYASNDQKETPLSLVDNEIQKNYMKREWEQKFLEKAPAWHENVVETPAKIARTESRIFESSRGQKRKFKALGCDDHYTDHKNSPYGPPNLNYSNNNSYSCFPFQSPLFVQDTHQNFLTAYTIIPTPVPTQTGYVIVPLPVATESIFKQMVAPERKSNFSNNYCVDNKDEYNKLLNSLVEGDQKIHRDALERFARYINQEPNFSISAKDLSFLCKRLASLDRDFLKKPPLALQQILTTLTYQALKAPQQFVHEYIASIFNLFSKFEGPENIKWHDLLCSLASRTVRIADTFDQKSIALTFNFISKFNLSNSAYWYETLESLAPRICEISDSLNPQNISLIANLITTTLKNPANVLWQRVSKALAVRTVAIAKQFKPCDIAPMYNLISKFDNCNDAQWHPVLRALAIRVVEVAKKFNYPHHITLIFKFFSKLDDVERAGWQDVISCLSRRFIELSQYEKFNLKNISIMCKFIASLENPNDSQWNELLECLNKQVLTIFEKDSSSRNVIFSNMKMIYKVFEKLNKENREKWVPALKLLEKFNTKWQWMDFWKNLKNMRNQRLANIETSVDKKENHESQILIDFAINHDIKLNQLDRLGNVIKHDVNYYFLQSEESMNCAVEFLDAFWSLPDGYQNSILSHRNKKKMYGHSSIAASCISFNMATISGEKICFVTINSHNAKLLKQLSDFTDKYVGSDSKIKYKFFNEDVKKVNEIIVFLTGDKNADNLCSEKISAKILIDQFSKFGNAMQVTGVANCFFYPYQVGKRYGNAAESEDTFIRPLPKLVMKTNSAHNFVISFMTCCGQCMRNKAAMLTLFKAAQNVGQNTPL